MPEFFEIHGLDQLKRLGEVLRAEGGGSVGLDKGVKNNLARELRTVGKPVGEAIKAAYREEMPHGGGLNEYLASSRIGVRNRFTGTSAGTTIVVTKKDHDLDAIEDGKVRHPVYGNRGVWAEQEVPSNVAGKAFDEMAPEISLRVDAAVERVITEIEAAG